MNSFNFYMSGGSFLGCYFLFVDWFVLCIIFLQFNCLLMCQMENDDVVAQSVNRGKGRFHNRRLGFTYNRESLAMVTRGKTKQMFTDVGELIDLLMDAI